MSEKLCLKWNDFQDNVNTAFGNLREDNEFADVTLASEDGQQIEAHKVILAASSPSSTPAERVISALGFVLNKQRQALGSELFSEIMFLSDCV